MSEIEKKPNIQTELTVVRKKYITPHFIRIYLTGEDIPAFANTTVGINNKIAIPPKGINQVYFPKKDLNTGEIIQIDESFRPSVRTYTHRGIDLDTNEIWIDFVAHGDEGPASEWAINAQAGDVLGVMMKNQKLELYTQADEYLLVGDATAIPVLSAILEDLKPEIKGKCVIEVHGEEDVQALNTKADINFFWLFNQDPKQGSELSDFVKKLELPEGSRFAYIAGEFTTVRDLRTYLRKEKDWTNREVYAYSYWKAGVAEDRSVTARREEKNSIS